jgi:hypothetical protein
MILLVELSIGELAAFVADHLRNKGIDVVLVGEPVSVSTLKTRTARLILILWQME